ncbi:hypothetical protein V8E53_007139 [Lactarius tabidus]
MPATRSARKVTKKTPYAKSGATSPPNNGKTLPPELRLSTMGPNANANGDSRSLAKKKNTTQCRGKSATATADAHSPDARAEEDLVPVAKAKKCAGRGKTGQGTSTPVKPTRALPNRPGRNIHPAGLQKSRRSKEQVEADRKAALKASEEQAHKSQMAQDLLARMNILEEVEDEDLPTQYLRRLSARIDKRHYADIETESDECFDIRVESVDEDSDRDSPSKPDKATEAKPKRTKHIKGAARQELLSRTTALRLAEHNEKSQAGVSKHGVERLTPQDFVCKKYTHSGLHKQPPTPPNAAHDQQEETADLDPFKFGGLCDDNIEETRPTTFKGSRALVTTNQSDLKNTSRSNELVMARVKGKDVHQGKPQAAPKPSKSKATKATVKQSLHKGQVQQECVDLNPLIGACPDLSQQCLDDARWTHVFLPTLTHALYVSDHPFTDWTWGSSQLIDTIQTVFNLSFTNISYVLNPEDRVIKAAYDRMKTRRSKLANEILVVVKTFFDSAEFRDQPERVREYVRWALRLGGPAYYETPVPLSCKLRKDDPNYPKPDGFLCSQFVLPIAKSYIGFAAKSVLHPSLGPRNPPIGLYALILTALERALRAHMTGAFNAPGDFNHRTTWNPMKDFYKILNRVHESHWGQALSFEDYNDSMESHVDDSMLSAYRMDFYLPPSSPTCDTY